MDFTNNKEVTAAMALTCDYDRIALIDIETGRIVSDDINNVFSPLVEGNFEIIGYDGQLNCFVEQLVEDKDKSRVLNAMDLDLVCEKLYRAPAYYVNYRIIVDGNIHDYQTKFCNVPSVDMKYLAIGTYDISAQLAECINRLAPAGKQSDAAGNTRSAFLTNLSHDIRTPLNGVMGLMEMAKRNVTDVEKVSKYLESMTNESNHLQSLLNDVLDISSLEDNHVTIIHRPMNITLFADNCVSIVSGRLIGKEVNLSTEFGSFTHPYILGDELHMQKVIVHILDNAIKFTRDGDIIFFRIHEENSDDNKVSVRFEIEDTGIGMRPEFIDHIFDPFSQEFKGSSSSVHGSGLGLTITKKLIDLMDGSISVKSTQGIGSKFTIRMTFDIDKETESSLSGRQPTMQECLKGIRILLVEDDNINRTITQSILQAEGAETDSAESGEEAIKMYSEADAGCYNIILMDILLPGIDGLEATRAIRSLGRVDSTTIPIIATTGNAFEEDIRKSQEAGMNAHLSKPVNAKLLTETVLKYASSSSSR